MLNNFVKLLLVIVANPLGVLVYSYFFENGVFSDYLFFVMVLTAQTFMYVLVPFAVTYFTFILVNKIFFKIYLPNMKIKIFFALFSISFVLGLFQLSYSIFTASFN